MITVNDISVQFGGTTLFSNVSFAINENDKIALMGKNGAGKSTLMKIIAGRIEADAGEVWRQPARALRSRHVGGAGPAAFAAVCWCRAPGTGHGEVQESRGPHC